MKNEKKKVVFLAIALCKFGHRKFDISKIITAMSFKLGQVIVNNEEIIWREFKKSFFLVIALCKFLALKTCNQDISKSITASSFKLGQLIGDNE